MSGGARPVKFFADAMLGSLARWLRALGFDTAYESGIDDGVLAQKAVDEGRIVLTRDALLVKRRALKHRCVFIESGEISGQLKQALKTYPPEARAFLSLCLRCNARLIPAGRGEVKDKVPPYVFAAQESFSKCPLCNRVYWRGTHAQKMIERIEAMTGVKLT